MLCVHDVDDQAHAKERRLGRRLAEAISRCRTAAGAAQAMVAILGDHTSGDDPRDAACLHGERYGTVSASVITLDATGRVGYRHAPGRPCVTRFEEIAIG